MQKRSSIVGGLIMIVVGAFFLLLQFSPSLAAQIDFGRQWPLLDVGLGVFFLLGALLGTPPLAVPPSSCRRTVIVAEPNTLAAGVKVRSPVTASMAGGVGNNVVLSLLTTKLPVCPDTLAGPKFMPLAQPATVCKPASSATD